ncbi:MAG: hypothetical protein ACYTX0_59820 [Nostoc sp.]
MTNDQYFSTRGCTSARLSDHANGFSTRRYANATSLLRLRQRRRYFDFAQYKSVQVSTSAQCPITND